MLKIYQRLTSSRVARLARGATCIVAMMLFSVGMGACGGAQIKTGMRDGFKPKTSATISLSPFYSLSSFSLSPSQRRLMLEGYEAAAAEALVERGYQVKSARELEHELTERGLWQEYIQGATLEHELARYFEPGPEVASLLPAQTLKRLAKEGGLGDALIFFGQVVYQSHGICQRSASQNLRLSPHVEVRHDPAAPALPSPCVISHFQAKLVDAASGETFWYNKSLLEQHVKNATEEARRENIKAVVRLVILGEDGLVGAEAAR